jgi:hypothetical protein
VRFYEPVISNCVINVVEANSEMLILPVVEVERGQYINFFINSLEKAPVGAVSG